MSCVHVNGAELRFNFVCQMLKEKNEDFKEFISSPFPGSIDDFEEEFFGSEEEGKNTLELNDKKLNLDFEDDAKIKSEEEYLSTIKQTPVESADVMIQDSEKNCDFQYHRRNIRGQFLRYFHRHGMFYRTLSDVCVQEVYSDNIFRKILGDPFYSIPVDLLQGIVNCGFDFVGDKMTKLFLSTNVLAEKCWANGSRCGFLTKISHLGDSKERGTSCMDNTAIQQELIIDDLNIIDLDENTGCPQRNAYSKKKLFQKHAIENGFITRRGVSAQLNARNYLRCGQVLFGWPSLKNENAYIRKEALASVLSFYNLMYFKQYGYYKDEEVFKSFHCNWTKTIDYLFGPLQAQMDRAKRFRRPKKLEINKPKKRKRTVEEIKQDVKMKRLMKKNKRNY